MNEKRQRRRRQQLTIAATTASMATTKTKTTLWKINNFTCIIFLRSLSCLVCMRVQVFVQCEFGENLFHMSVDQNRFLSLSLTHTFFCISHLTKFCSAYVPIYSINSTHLPNREHFEIDTMEIGTLVQSMTLAVSMEDGIPSRVHGTDYRETPQTRTSN